MLYLFHGTSGRASDWVMSGNAVETTADLPVIVVMPDAGFDGDGGGWFANWFNGGPGGQPMWETFHVEQVIPWVDANLKESDFTHVAEGQKVDIDVDAFPDHAFKGTIGSLSPGTGAQFAILPPQNATGNFVKVVQRVPVRIYFDRNDSFVRKLKAGMSVYATIDTKHRRSLANLFGSPAVAAKED